MKICLHFNAGGVISYLWTSVIFIKKVFSLKRLDLFLIRIFFFKQSKSYYVVLVILCESSFCCSSVRAFLWAIFILYKTLCFTLTCRRDVSIWREISGLMTGRRFVLVDWSALYENKNCWSLRICHFGRKLDMTIFVNLVQLSMYLLF